MYTKDKHEIMEELLRRRKVLQAALDKWAVKFGNNPGYALEWAEGIFETAAKFEVNEALIDWFSGDRSYEEIKAIVEQIVVDKAKYPARSTSKTSNLMSDYRLACYAYELDGFDGVLGTK